MFLDFLIEDFAAAIAAEPEDAMSLNRAGLERLSEGDGAGALAAFRGAVAIAPGFAPAWNNLGRLLQSSGRMTEAVAAFNAALVATPGHPQSLNNRGLAFQDLGQLDAALADFDLALAHARGRFAAVVLHNRGALRHEAGDSADALADFDLAIAIDPGLVNTRVHRASARKALGDIEGALVDVEHALSQLPRERSAEALHLRGGLKALRDDFQGAVEDYSEALEISPRSACFAISRGHARYHLRDRRALLDYRLGYELDPKTAVRECVRTIVDDARRRPFDVLENCEKHLRINPNDAPAYLRRGLTLVFLGREEQAEADFARGLERMGPAREFAALVVEETCRIARGEGRA